MRIEKLSYDGEGYMSLMEFMGWRVAIANFREGLLEKNLSKIERHLETDEVFILLEGKATLHIGEEMEKHPMEKGMVYNVKKGEWHSISMLPDTKVAIIENSGTSEENTEFIYF